MAEPRSAALHTVDRFVQVGDGEMYVAEDGNANAPALLLIHGAAASTAYWDAVVPALADAFRVIRVDLLGHGRSSSPRGGYDIPAQAGRVGIALDKLGVRRWIVIGHSTGSTVATALAEQRPHQAEAVGVIDMGPDQNAKIQEPRLARLLLAPVVGPLLWRLKTEATVRKAMRSAFARPVEIPLALVDGLMGMTHPAFAGTMRAPLEYMREGSLSERLAVLGLPVLIIFGSQDQRWRPESAAAYRDLPEARVELLMGVGHTPMVEDPQRTSKLLREFCTAVARSG